MPALRRLKIAALTLAALLAIGLVAAVPIAAKAAANLVANPGFEAGSLSGWNCSPLASVVTSPVHSGTYALAGAANNSDNAQCTQAIAVQPSTAYSLSGYVEGAYVYIGDSGTGTSDTSNWTPSASSWQLLSTSFTTGAATTSVTIYVHGWYAQGTYFADDFTLTGPGGTTTPPAAPTGLAVTATTSSSASLSWTAPAGTVTSYNVYQNGAKVGSATGTTYTATGLSAATSYTFAVTAVNAGGESAESATVTATTQSSGGTTAPAAPTGLVATATTSNSVSLSWTAPAGTVTGYNVYENGTQVSTSTTTSATVTGLAASTSYTFTVAAYNSAGTGPTSTGVTATTTAASTSEVSTPTGVTATFTGSTSVTLSWAASTDSSQTGDVPAYYVFEGTNIVAASAGTSVTVSDLSPATAYTFTVEGYDVAGFSSAQSAPVTVTTAAAAAAATPRKVAYYDQWSIYGNAYYPSTIVSSGAAAKLNTIIYDFENIDPTNGTCFEAIKAADTNDSDPNAGDGAGDAFADYQKSYTSANSVDGSNDAYSQPIEGTFNQLRELKAKYPNMKILLSIGGWTYSKYFSQIAATAASRQKFVSSCITMFLQGDLPTGVGGDQHGGAAAAAGIFDGFDIDWEFPASAGGHTGNITSPADTANFTLLLQEFRNQLTAYGQKTGRYYQLASVLPSGQDKISLVQTSQIGQYLDFGDIETYDMHGAWETTTNFQGPLHNSASDPSAVIPPGNEKYNADTSITAYTKGLPDYGIPGGFPASKINFGIPFYYRGWTGVPAGSNDGLYQSATGASPAFSISQVPGVADWKELASAGLTSNASDDFFDSTTDSAWIYDGTNFYTGETPQSIAAADAYVKAQGLGGVFAFSLDQDDSASTLLNAMTGGL